MFILPNLPAPVSYEAYATLCQMLPEYPDDTDDSRAHRAAVAMAGVADLYPANAFQARLAVKVIATDAQASDCFSLARQHKADFEKRRQCIAQADGLMRQTQRLYRTLRQDQQLRRQPGPSAGARILEAWFRDCLAPDEQPALPDRSAEPAEAAADRPEECVPADAIPAELAPAADLIPTADPPSETAPIAPADTPQAAASPPEPAPQHQPAEPAPHAAEASPAPPDPIQQAEDYAMQLGVYATMIRADGGLSPRVRSRVPASQLPQDPAVIHALVHGDSELLRVLDEMAHLVDEADADEQAELLAA